MRKGILAGVLLVAAVPCLVLAAGSGDVNTGNAGGSTQMTQKEKVSYSIGRDIGDNLKSQEIDVDAGMLARGISDSISGAAGIMSESERQAVMAAFQQELMAKRTEKRKVDTDKNKAEGQAFLEKNKKNKGVKVLPSGLQYKVLVDGKGAKPGATDTVKVNYRGTLINGKEFDSSYKRGTPATFPVNGVIKGWTEALQLMKTGSKWELYIPSEIAYGERGAGADIGPNATLIFTVELLSIEKKGQ